MALATDGRGGTNCNDFGRSCVCDARIWGGTRREPINAGMDKNGLQSNDGGHFRPKFRHFRNKLCHSWHTAYHLFQKLDGLLGGVGCFILWVDGFFVLTGRLGRGSWG